MTMLGGSGDAGNQGGGNGSGGTPGAGGASGAGGAPAAGAGTGGSGASQAGAGGAGGSGTALAGNAGGAVSWRDSLPDELKNDPTLAKFSDVPNLSKSYLELQKKIGSKGIIKPGKDASPEEWKSFREALGVPAADKYELNIPKDVQFPQESIDWAKKTCAEIGLLPEDASKLMAEYAKFEIARDSAAAEKLKAASTQQMDGLKKEWGEQYDINVQRAHFAAKTVGGDDFIKYLNESGLGNDVQLIKFVQKVSGLLGEDRLREGNLGDGRMSSQELDGKIREVQGQMLGMKSTDGRYPGLKAQYESLWKQKTGGR